MAASTIYDVRVQYTLSDRASRGLKGIGREANRASKNVSKLGSTVRRLAIGAAGFFTFRAAKKHLIDYNATMDEARITMGLLIKMNMGGTWAENQKKANKLVRQFTKDAAVGVGTTKDYIEFASAITKPLLDAGGSMKDLTALTKGGVTAAKALGIAGDVAGRDIQQALMGTLRNVDRLPKLMGINAKEWNEMVRLKGARNAATELVKIFSQPAITDAADAYGKSWSGVTSTLEDNLDRAFAKVGLPLMKAISKEIVGWNKWFDANEKKVNAWAKSMASGLVGAFKTAKKVVAFLVDHKDLLLKLARAYIVFKGVGFLAGGLLGGAQGISGFLKNLKKTGGPLKAMAGNLNLAVAGLAGLAVAADAIAQGVLERQEKNIKKEVRATTLGEESRRVMFAATRQEENLMKLRGQSEADFRELAAERLVREAKREKIIGEKGELSPQALSKVFGIDKYAAEDIVAGGAALKKRREIMKLTGREIDAAMFMEALKRAAPLIAQKERRGEFVGAVTGLGGTAPAIQTKNAIVASVEALKSAVTPIQMLAEASFRAQAAVFQPLFDNIKTVGDAFQDAFITPLAKTLGIFEGLLFAEDGDVKKTAKTNVNVTVRKIEVVSDDPDRIAFGLVGAFQDLQHNPVQSRRLYPGGRPG